MYIYIYMYTYLAKVRGIVGLRVQLEGAAGRRQHHRAQPRVLPWKQWCAGNHCDPNWV